MDCIGDCRISQVCTIISDDFTHWTKPAAHPVTVLHSSHILVVIHADWITSFIETAAAFANWETKPFDPARLLWNGAEYTSYAFLIKFLSNEWKRLRNPPISAFLAARDTQAMVADASMATGSPPRTHKKRAHKTQLKIIRRFFFSLTGEFARQVHRFVRTRNFRPTLTQEAVWR